MFKKILLAFFSAIAATIGGKLAIDEIYPRLQSVSISAVISALAHDHVLQTALLSLTLMISGYVFTYRKIGFGFDRPSDFHVLGMGGLIVGTLIPFIFAILDGNMQPLLDIYRDSPYSSAYTFALAALWIISGMLRRFFQLNKLER